MSIYCNTAKTPESAQVRSYRGSYSTLVTYGFMVFLIWVQIGGFIDGFIDHQYSVDEIIRSSVNLNVDIMVKMPCKYLDANIRDITEDRNMAEEVLNFEGFQVPNALWNMGKEKNVFTPDLDEVLSNSLEADYVTKGVRKNLDAPACRIYGSVPINRVEGDFHITAEGHGYMATNGQTPEDVLDFTHFISEFSFGKFYPYIDNALDLSAMKTNEKRHTYHYGLKVVPTVYSKLGHKIDTNQYSVRLFETTNKFVPGIFFKYDFEPIKMSVIEKRLSFFQFVIRLVTIIGGLWVIAQWSYNIMEKLIVIFFGKEYARRGEEKKRGLLDEEPEDTFEKI